MISAARPRWRDFLTLMCCNGTNVLQNFPAWIHRKHLHRGGPRTDSLHHLARRGEGGVGGGGGNDWLVCLMKDSRT